WLNILVLHFFFIFVFGRHFQLFLYFGTYLTLHVESAVLTHVPVSDGSGKCGNQNDVVVCFVRLMVVECMADTSVEINRLIGLIPMAKGIFKGVKVLPE